MSLFKNKIDTSKGIVYSVGESSEIGKHRNKKGYSVCLVKDCYNNNYYYIHDVIIAEALQLPKHLWPLDEKGRRYEVDHIIPLSNGGTNQISNLRLVSHKDNQRNRETIENFKISNKTKTTHLKKKVDLFSLCGELLMSFESQTEAAEFLGCSQQLVSRTCNGKNGKILNKYYVKKSN